jgi:hypothetical protein
MLQAFHGCCSSGRSHASAAQYEAIPESTIFHPGWGGEREREREREFKT